MANTTQVAKATITSTTQDNLVVLPPKIQTQVKVLREARNIAKQAKATGDTSRDAILDFVGNITKNLVGTDAKGKRLISVKVIESPASFDWKRLEENDPELYKLVSKYQIPKGSGTPTLRVDII
jgi:hypothetical protein